MFEWLQQAQDLITAHKIPIGAWVKVGVDWLTDNFFWFFDTFSSVLKFLIDSTVAGLEAVPPLILTLLIAAIGYLLHRSWFLVVGTVLGLLLILNLGFWAEMVETLALVLYSTLFSLLIGIPTGIFAARRPWFYAALRPVLDMMQTIPSFVYLIPALIFFGVGTVPGLIATLIFAVPAPIRLTHLGIVGVPKPLIEAGEAFGSTPRQVLWRVELPYALPTIMAGVNQCIMLSLSMVVIAAQVGSAGLGVPVLRALASVNIAQGFEAGLAIVIAAIVLDRILKKPGKSGAMPGV